MKPRLLLALLALLVAPLYAQKNVQKSDATATRDEITADLKFGTGKTGTFLTGSALTLNSGSTLTLNGAIAGTPTGGTLSLANLTLTLPATVSGGGSSFQPLDSDLTAIAALSTATAGRSLLTLASVPAGALVGTSDTQTLTGKTLSGAANTFSAIPNSGLGNSTLTLGSTSLALGSTTTALAGLTTISASGIATFSNTTAATTSAGAVKIGAQTGSDYINLGGGGGFFGSSVRATTYGDSTDSRYLDFTSATSIKVNGAHLLWQTDNTYDIGASGATRPRNLFTGGTAFIGSTVRLTNATESEIQSYTGAAYTPHTVDALSYAWKTSGGTADLTIGTTGITTATVQLIGKGTATNDNAATGYIGEYVSATAAGSAVSLSTGTAATVTSISLSAGDWDVFGNVEYALTGATTSQFTFSPSATTNTLSATSGDLAKYPVVLTTTSDNFLLPMTTTRISLAATTTYYLVARATFSAGSITAGGTIKARRVR